jgi:uncharacterized protein (TIGR00369 family)
MTSSEHYRSLENLYLAAPINQMFSPSIKIDEGRAEVKIEVRREYFHAANAVHGALYFKLLDDAAFFAVNSLVTDVFVLTVQFNLHLMRPISDGVMLSKGVVIQDSPRLYIAESYLEDSDQNIIARGSGSFIKSKLPLEPEIGYVL